jgi:PAS domain S-box-containing protein
MPATAAKPLPADDGELFRLLVESVTDYAVFVCDTAGCIARWNTGAERLIGYSETEALGQPSALIFAPQDRDQGAPEQEMRTAESEGRALDERWHQRKDGSLFWASGILTALRDDAGNLRGYVKILRDYTHHKQREEQLQAAFNKEHRIAEALQQSLLLAPSMDALPGLAVEPFYRPALDDAMVGGDFYDAFVVDGGRVALVVGDASGKGLAAAARTAEVKYAVRAFLHEYPYPARALSRVNDFLCSALRGSAEQGPQDEVAVGGFVVLTLAIVDPVNGEVMFSVAGSEPPLLVRSDCTRAEPLDLAGFPLGIEPGVDYDVASVRMTHRDSLILVTDGITEARQGGGPFGGRGKPVLGYEGMMGLARKACALPSLQQMGQAILDGAQSYAGGRLQDDACLLLARLK